MIKTWVLINSCDLIISNGFFKYVQFKLWINFQSWNWIKFWRSTKVWKIQKEWKPILGIFGPSCLFTHSIFHRGNVTVRYMKIKSKKKKKVLLLVKFNFNSLLSILWGLFIITLYIFKRGISLQSSLIVLEDGRSRVSDVRGWPGDWSAMIRPLLLSHKQPPVLATSGTWGQ